MKCPEQRHVHDQGNSAIKATLYLCLNQIEQPPFRLVSHSIMSDARLRRVNKEIAGVSDGQFTCKFILIRHRLQERQVVENQY